MTSTLYYSKIAATATADNATAGYPASNVANEDILMPWRSTGTGGVGVYLQFTSSVVKALLVEDVNFSSADVGVYYGGAWHFSVATLTTVADKLTGRRRGLVDLSAQPACTYVAFWPSGITDGKSYFSVGAAYLFAASSVLALEPWVNSLIRATYPKVVNGGIPNGRIAQATTGPPFLSVPLVFRRTSTQDELDIARRSQFATCGLDLNLGDMPRLSLPFRMIRDDLSEDYLDGALNSFTVEVTEVITA